MNVRSSLLKIIDVKWQSQYYISIFMIVGHEGCFFHSFKWHCSGPYYQIYMGRYKSTKFTSIDNMYRVGQKVQSVL